MNRLIAPFLVILIVTSLSAQVTESESEDLDFLLRAAHRELEDLEEQIAREESRLTRIEAELVQLRHENAIKSSAQSAFILGEELYTNGSIVWAKDAFESVVNNFPESSYYIQALFRLELINFELQDYEISLEYYDELQQTDPAFEYIDLAQITASLSHFSCGEFVKCRQMLEQISPSSDFSVLAGYLKAVAYVEEGESEAATAALQNILDRAGSHREEAALADRARIALAEIMTTDGRYDEALSYYDNISPFSSYYDIGMLSKVWVLMRMEEYQEAYNLAEKVLREVPTTELRNEFELAMANSALGAEDLEIAVYRYERLMNEHRHVSEMQTLFQVGITTPQEEWEDERDRLDRIRLGLAELKEEAYTQGDLELVEIIEDEEAALRNLFVEIASLETQLSLPINQMSTTSMVMELNRLISENRDQTEALVISIGEVQRLAESQGSIQDMEDLSRLSGEVERIRLALQDLGSKFESGLVQSHQWLQETQYGIAIANYIARELKSDSLRYIDGQYSHEISEAYASGDSVKAISLQQHRQAESLALQERMDMAAVNTAILFEEYLASFPESRFTPDVLVRLAQLYYDIDQAAYFDLIDQGSGEIFIEQDYSRSINLYERVLNAYPGSEVEDVALYSMGYCLQVTGDPVGAVINYRRLLEEHPESPLAPETYIRTGDFYFDTFAFDSAEVYYKRILDYPGANPDLYQLGIYKLGWTYYLLNDYLSSVAVFGYLIRDSERMDELDIPRRSGDMVDEAIEYVAHDFMEQSQYPSVFLAARFLDYYGDENVSRQVLENMGKFYMEQGFWAEAIKTYDELIQRHPLIESAPYLQEKIALCYDALGDNMMANQARELLIENYGLESEWATAVGEETAMAATDSLRGSTIRQAIGFYHAQAVAAKQENPELSINHWEALLRRIETYISEFPDSRENYEFRFLLGEAHYNLGHYIKAGDAYIQVAMDSTSSLSQEDACINGSAMYITAYQEMTGIDSALVREKQKSAIDLYASLYPQGEYVPEFYFAVAANAYNAKDYSIAINTYQQIYNNYPNSEYVARSARFIAAAYEAEQMYGEAEEWYGRAADASARTGEDLGADFELLAASVAYKDAEALAQSEDVETLLAAALRFEESARAHSESSVAPTALYDAGETYAKAGDIENSIRCFRDIARMYPDNELAAQGMLRAAFLALEAEYYIQSGDTYLAAYQMFPNHPDVSSALYSAALAYEKGERIDLAVDAYDRIISSNLGTAQIMVEVMGKYGKYLYEDLYDYNRANGLFQECVEIYDQYRVGNAYFPAMSSFYLGEMSFDDYSAVYTTESTATTKTQLMQVAESWYAKSLTYLDEYYFMASCVRVGELYEDYANAIGYMEPPERIVAMGEEALDAFYMELFPLLEQYLAKAVDVYKVAVEKAISAGIDNEWVYEAADHLELMAPGTVAALGGLPGYGGTPPLQEEETVIESTDEEGFETVEETYVETVDETTGIVETQGETGISETVGSETETPAGDEESGSGGCFLWPF